MVSFPLADRVSAVSFVVVLLLGGCGSVALSPSGTGGAGAAGGTQGSGGSGAAAGHDAGADGGRAGAGGSSDGGPSPGAVTLRLNVPPSRSFCDQTCGAAQHITILTLDAQRVPTDVPFCAAMCGDCQPVACPVGGACLLTGVAVTGAEVRWDGRSYPLSTCGAGVTCYQPTFVPAGQYVAHMCATPGTLDKPAGQPPVCTATAATECIDVVFDLPGKDVVEGALSGT